jgi:hypothetical protein
MKKFTAKRVGEFEIETNKRGYTKIKVEVAIEETELIVVLKEEYDGTIKMTNFISKSSGDNSPMQFDFSAYSAIGIEIDISGIIAEATEALAVKRAEEKIKRDEAKKLERAKEYDSNRLLRELKPALEEKGYQVVADPDKEKYVETGYSISLKINGKYNAGFDFRDYFQVSNGLYGLDQIEKSTKSMKISKMIEIVEDVITRDDNRTRREKEEREDLDDAKAVLESVLGIEVVEKEEGHRVYGKSNSYYYTKFFQKKDDKYYDSIKFVKGCANVNGKPVDGFKLENLPLITDMEKLKKVYELLTTK